MEEIILISYLNDFIFCPVSIYFHKLYGKLDKILYQQQFQINGTAAHETIDMQTYSTRKDVLQGIDVYSEKYKIMGKIDVFDCKSGVLTERKNKIIEVYDGYVFQVYAQYFALIEMGYDVKKIRLHSMEDNKNYNIKLPEEDIEMFKKFESIIREIREFDIEKFTQTNVKKCEKCIYEPSCDRSLIC